ncbi:MAG: DNA-binding domain-containing protein [Polyangiaceae bacterium]
MTPPTSHEERQELDELQRWMASKLRELRGLPKDEPTTALARRHFTGNDRLSPVEQLEVYRQQFWLRHTSALLEDFPGLSGILGQRDWERLTESYLGAHAPTSFTLRDLGAALPAHVASSDWLPNRELCADMARLEWAYVELFDSELLPSASPEKIAGVPEEAWNGARLALQPNLQFVSSRYPVAELRPRCAERSSMRSEPSDSASRTGT